MEKQLNNQPKRNIRYIKFLVAFFLVSLICLVISYFLLAYLSNDKSLPRVSMMNRDVSSLDANNIEDLLSIIDKAKSDQKIIIEFDGKKVSKTYSEIGLSIDRGKTVSKVLNYGKINGFYPSSEYVMQTIKSSSRVEPVLTWSNGSTTVIDELFADKKTDPKPAKYVISDNDLNIENEDTGYQLDINDVKLEIERKYIENSYPKVTGVKKETTSNMVASELSYYKEDAKAFVFKELNLVYNFKKILIDKDDMLGLIDLERTILEQKISISDSAIKSYLENKIASKINVTGKKRVISTYDNSVISEGKEGVQIDNDRTLENIKNAISTNSNTAKIETSVTEIVEELRSPGFSLGKYSGKYIEVNLSQQMLYTIEGDKLISSYKVSTGKWSMPTPVGEYYINNKNARAYSQKYALYMPYWMAFIGSEYGIHELPEWPDGTKEGESHLGTPVSHGCIRLGRGSAEQVYNWAEIGTLVYIHK